MTRRLLLIISHPELSLSPLLKAGIAYQKEDRSPDSIETGGQAKFDVDSLLQNYFSPPFSWAFLAATFSSLS